LSLSFLVNREIREILRCARLLGFQVHLYTTGFNLRPADRALWDELALVDQARFSVHSPDAATYNAITGLPAQLHALGRVVDNIRTLRDLRDQRRTGAQMGMGVVTQPRNYDRLQPMANLAAATGVDFLDLRKDEVNVTDQLTGQQFPTVRDQLRTVRARAVRGAQCMPSSRTGNAVYAKLLADYTHGIGPADQPFLAAQERPDLPAVAATAGLRDRGAGK
jgi:molybdenum cofactor biosynthesis enzyme MoaA